MQSLDFHMHTLKTIIFSILAIGFSSFVFASSGVKYRFVCDFNYGSIKRFDGQGGHSSTKSKIGRMVFEQIDFLSRTGKVTREADQEDVTLIAWEGKFEATKVYILEKSETFNIIFTKIYIDKKSDNQKFPAVHSRYVSIEGSTPTILEIAI